MKAYPVDQLYAEMAFLAYHFHWSHGEVMSLEHAQRRRWCEEISQINRRLNGSSTSSIELI